MSASTGCVCSKEPWVATYERHQNCQECGTYISVPLKHAVEMPELKTAVESAVYEDHPCDNDNCCDVAAALRAGFAFSAAHLLSGATECPHVEALMGLIPYEQGWPIDWEEWTDWFKENTIKCDSCGAYNFIDECTPDTCGNCMASLSSSEEEDTVQGNVGIFDKEVDR